MAEIGQKLAIPLLTVVAGGLGVYLNYEANERARQSREEQDTSARQLSLMNQREQSDMLLRSTMFRELVGALLSGNVGGKQESAQSAEQLAVTAELLTLNFHESFELGPALRHVDQLPGQTPQARARLRSAARRVISRQLMVLLPERLPDVDTFAPPYVELFLRGDPEDADSAAAAALQLPTCRTEGTPDSRSASVQLVCSRGRRTTSDGKAVVTAPLTITSPDGRDRVIVALWSLNWQDQSVAVFASLVPTEQRAAPRALGGGPPWHGVSFTLTTFSMPYSDNTLLPSGNRFGLYITSIDDMRGVGQLMKVAFVWFPRSFVPPQERPFNLDLAEWSAGPRPTN